RYCANFVLGCKPVSAAELAGIKSPDQQWHNFVTVTGSKSVSTGYQEVEKRTQNGQVVSTEIKDEYVLLRVGEKLLLVKAPPGKEQLEYSGELEYTTDRVKEDLLRPLASEEADSAA